MRRDGIGVVGTRTEGDWVAWVGSVPYHTTQLSITRPSVRLSTHAVRHHSTAQHIADLARLFQHSRAALPPLQPPVAFLLSSASPAQPSPAQPSQPASQPASQNAACRAGGASSSLLCFAFFPALPCWRKLRMTDGLPAYLPTYPIGMPRQLSSAQLSCFSRGAAARVHVCFCTVAEQSLAQHRW
jgi:hypothetical protein